ncbi:5'/3'-nucleotidase SurE [Virgisporangium aliadipatigenens]|uniref:5'-nucleotidase n=1 Tax=Virgisporangium aliadipatigenens TaxID=741659 RepID=A0A8J3YL26_9ACTN|nr:5'/3'-nucleotidase SurE [Virgisporangium aliadipatigenens]GIJ45935.1 5'/3'-nucleotidase SurE [Virgisporangium aliadipatigenens]
MRVLITNDDGIDSPGLVALAGAAQDVGWEVLVAAPSQEFSGASAALTAVERGGRILTQARELPELPGVPAFSVAASPAFVALIALHGALGPVPDVVLSGVNFGPNAGRAVTHSGTVGAALTAALDGRRAAAFSIGLSIRMRQQPKWETARVVAADLLPVVADLPPGVVLNVNVPDLPYADLRGVRRGGLANFGAVQFGVVERDPEGYVGMQLTDTDAELEADSDEFWMHRGYVSVTPIRPVAEALDVAVPLDGITVGGVPAVDGYAG